MNELGASSAVDLSFFSDETSFQSVGESVRVVKSEQPTKRKRGRPRTRIPPVVQYDSNGNPIKKQRGRPRKDPASIESKQGQSIGLFDENVAPLKKRRGRPRKALIDPKTISFNTEEYGGNSNGSALSFEYRVEVDNLPGSLAATNKEKQDASLPILPKKRGRPKKSQECIVSSKPDSMNETIEKLSDSVAQQSTKKKRGRPRKTDAEPKTEPNKETTATNNNNNSFDHYCEITKASDEVTRYVNSSKEDEVLPTSLTNTPSQNFKDALKDSIKYSKDAQDNSTDPSFLPTSDYHENEHDIKIENVNEADVNIPKHPLNKRGRPKKIVRNEELSKVKRPRGRPPKNAISQPNYTTTDILNTEKFQSILSNKLSNTDKITTEVEASPKRKVKLSKGRRYHISNDTVSSAMENTSIKDDESNKAIVFDFKKHSIKNTKPNIILDDSYDVFSFDNNGNSNFVIPEHVLPSQAKDSNCKPAQASDLEPLKERLELIDTNVEFSDDSNSESSSQVESPSILNDCSLRPPLDSVDKKLEASNTIKPPASSENACSQAENDKLSQISETKPTAFKEQTATCLDDWSLNLSFQDMNDHGTSVISSNLENEQTLKMSVPSSPTVSHRINNNSNEYSSSSNKLSHGSPRSNEQEFSVIPILPKWSELPNEMLTTSSKDIIMLHQYFEDLLCYMNRNDASLTNDIKGDLSFFINQMPIEELKMNFHEWLDSKGKNLYSKFEMDVDKRLILLKKQFEVSRQLIEEIDDDDVLLKLAKRYNIKY